eukprot:TRINITY_DN19590_c0_g1_i1.p1 TRINITY_DN19590_c0_g1~~TRINITY_DN19590_c0_g1_i1.p1  ORF type:complete len:323 (+),score=46.84 TRINITY_DN19590_c0_g1_i1:38-1006(+)
MASTALTHDTALAFHRRSHVFLRRADFLHGDGIQFGASRGAKTLRIANIPRSVPLSARAEVLVSLKAIVRHVPDSFIKSLAMDPKPIDVAKARKQHAAYVDVLRGLVSEIVELPADERYPDCPFVEDTAIVVGKQALITRPGAATRRGEECATREALLALGIATTEVEAPACIDGGDVLHVNNHLFVGLTSRTNEAGVAAVQAAFPDMQVVAVKMGEGGLHLKSVVSHLGGSLLAVEDSPSGHATFDALKKHISSFQPLVVPDLGAANTLYIQGSLLYPSAYSEVTNKIYDEGVPDRRHPLDMSEFHKADGGLTCLSIIIES